MSSRSTNRTSSMRRSRSPRRKKTLSPGPLRRRGPVRGKRPPSRGSHEERHKTKKTSPRNRRKTSPRLRTSPSSTGRWRSYSGSKGDTLDQSRGPEQFIVREGASNRLRSEDKYVVDRPLFRGPDKDVLMDRDSLKKIVVKMRDTPSRTDTIKRDIVNPEDINVVRREGEGSRPIFDRDEIINYGRKFEERERESRRIASRSPVYSGRRHSSSERFRAHERNYEAGHSGVRNHSRGRPIRDHDSHRSRDDRYPSSSRRTRSRSRERERDYPPERCDRLVGREGRRSFHRSPERDERLRRRLSPRRRLDDYRSNRDRDVDSMLYREREIPVEDYSDYAQEAHGYYEGEIRENPVLSPSRGRGHGFSLRRRGISATRAFPRPGEIIVHPAPPVRPIRGAFLPRVPGRRLPFPPRLVRPVVGPVIRVIAPVIPVRPPVLPVRPPPVIPVRHPVIPLPF